MVTINSAESNRARIRYIKEVVWGETPTSGISKEMRLTSSGLETAKETEVSQEIRADRMVPNIIEVAASSSGPIEFEFSAGSLDDFLEGFLLGTWSQAMNFWQVKGLQVGITATDEITVQGIDARPYLEVGNYLKLEGFKDVANNAYVEIAAVAFTAGNTVIDITGATLVVEAGNAFSKVLDANDVILKSTTTAFTSGNTINGGGSNSFAGKNLKVGQKIFLDGLGNGAGDITFEATNPAEGDTITISDGVDTVVFEIRTNAGLVAEGNVYVPLSGTEATMAASFESAVMDQFIQGKLRVSALATAGVVDLVNHRGAGGSVATDGGAAITATTFAGGSNTKRGFYTIASLPDDDTIVTVETLTADANGSSLPVTVKGSHVRNPGIVSEILKQSFSIETGFTDVNKYFLRNGMRPGSFELAVESGSIVTGSVEFMGRETLNSSVEVLGDTVAYDVQDSTATEVLNATSNVGTVTKNGVPLTSAVMAIEINGDASLREQRAVGEKFPAGIGYGRFSIEGSVTAYFETFDLYNDFLNHQTVSLGFDFTDVDNNTYFFRLPAVKFTADPIAPQGIDEDVMEELEFMAQRDPVLNTMFMVDRFSSVYPTTN